MATSDLLIKIDANIAGFKNQMKKVKDESKNLQESLSSAAKKSAIAFAAFTGAIGASLVAYRQQELAVNKLNASLRNQGIFSQKLTKRYQAEAAALQKLTTFGDEQIISAQAQLQNYLGQTRVTKDLTAAILDFASAQQVDLKTASDLVGKAIGSTTNALSRYGISIDASADKGTKLAQVVAALNEKFGGQAEAAADGLGATIQFKNALGDFVELVGKQFVPIVSKASKFLTRFVTAMQENERVAKLTATFLGLGTALAGLTLAVSTAGLAFIHLKNGMIAAVTVMKTLSLTMRGALIATGIGALLVAISVLAMNWDTVWPAMQATFITFVNNFKKIANGILNIFIGIANFWNKDGQKYFNKGMDQLVESFKKGMDEFKKIQLKTLKDMKKTSKTMTTSAGVGFGLGGDVSGDRKPAGTKKTEVKKQTPEEAALGALVGGDMKGAIVGALGAIDNAYAQAAVKFIEFFGVKTDEFVAKMDNMINYLAELPTMLAENVPIFIEKIVKELPRIVNAMVKAVPIIIQRLGELINDPEFINAMMRAGVAIQTGVWQDPKTQGAMLEAVWFAFTRAIPNAVQLMAEGIVKAIKDGMKGVGVGASAAGGFFGGLFNEGMNKGFIGAQQGLVVPGQSFHGDKVPVLANSGEIIQTPEQFASDIKSGGTTVNINGDVLADETFIDILVDRIREAIEFRNADIGVA